MSVCPVVVTIDHKGRRVEWQVIDPKDVKRMFELCKANSDYRKVFIK